MTNVEPETHKQLAFAILEYFQSTLSPSSKSSPIQKHSHEPLQGTFSCHIKPSF